MSEWRASVEIARQKHEDLTRLKRIGEDLTNTAEFNEYAIGLRKKLKKVADVEVDYDHYAREYDRLMQERREASLDALEYTHPNLSEQVNNDHFAEVEREKRKKQQDEEYKPEL